MPLPFPKVEFTRTPHAFIDIYLRDLSGTEVKVMMVIMRQTLGWSVSSKLIKLTEMAELTGLSRSTCCSAVKSLEDRGLVYIEKSTELDASCGGNTYSVQFDGEDDFGEKVLPRERVHLRGVNQKVRPAEQKVLPAEQIVRPAELPNKEERNYKERKERTPPYSFEDGYAIPGKRLSRIWQDQRGLPKLKRSDRATLEERAEGWKLTEDEAIACVSGFQANDWARERGYPFGAFLKDPRRWSEAVPEPPKPQPTRDFLDDPPASNPEVIQPGAVPPARDFVAEWNAIVVSCYAEWDHRSDVELLRKNAADPEFCARFEEVCHVAESIISLKANEASWVNFDWILKTKPGEKMPNWLKLLRNLRNMGKKGEKDKTSTEKAIESVQRGMEMARARRRRTEQGGGQYVG